MADARDALDHRFLADDDLAHLTRDVLHERTLSIDALVQRLNISKRLFLLSFTHSPVHPPLSS